MKKTTKTIGWKEWFGLDCLSLPAIKGKIDTGAKTSSLHAFNIESFYIEDVEYVKFDIHPSFWRRVGVFLPFSFQVSFPTDFACQKSSCSFIMYSDLFGTAFLCFPIPSWRVLGCFSLGLPSCFPSCPNY
jgi:hypothetical protein